MTPEQIKTLAQLAMNNDARLAHLTNILVPLMDDRINQLDFQNANIVRSALEQLSAFSRDGQALRQQISRDWGLIDP
jgi:hypothetical protein